MDNFKINIATSVNDYEEKPKKNEYKSCSFVYESLTRDELLIRILSGKIMAHNFHIQKWRSIKKGTFSRFHNQRYSNFEYANALFLDIDNIEIEFNDFINSLTIKPTIAYTTFSHGFKGNRYRLVYMLNDKIEYVDEYKDAITGLVNYIRTIHSDFRADRCSKTCTQPMYGTNSNALTYVSDNVYSKDIFLSYYNGENSKKPFKKTYNKKTQNYDFEINDKDFISDFYELDLYNRDDVNGFLWKYRRKYEYFDETKLDCPINEMGIILPELPEDYQKIWRFYITRYKKGEDGITRRKREVVKIPIGKRTATMYTFCQLRKVMRKDVTPEHLLYCLVQDVVYFFDMSDNEIDNSMLFVTAFKAYHDDMQVELKKDKRKYKANEIYCIIHNITKVQAARRFQKVLSDRKIGRYYNFSLSVKENMKILEEHDIHFCKSRIYAFRNEYKETGFHYDYDDECEENTITSEVEHTNEPTIVEEDEGLVMEHNEVEVNPNDEAYIPKGIEVNILKRFRLYKQHMKEHGLFISSGKQNYYSNQLQM